MTDIFTHYLVPIFTGLGGLGFFIGLLILWKMGMLEFIKNWKKNGNGVEKLLAQHIEDDKEMKEDLRLIKDNHLVHIQGDISEIKTDIAVIKEQHKTMSEKIDRL